MKSFTAFDDRVYHFDSESRTACGDLGVGAAMDSLVCVHTLALLTEIRGVAVARLS